MQFPFKPANNATVSIVVSASSQRVQVGDTGVTGTYQVEVHNEGTATVWIAWGDNTVTTSIPSGATAGGKSIAAGGQEVVTITGTHIAAIAAGATGNIFFVRGDGI